MAIPATPIQIHYIVKRISEKYGISVTRFVRVEDHLHNPVRTFHFTGAACDDNTRLAMNELRKSIDDEFRGPILQAAAPDTYARIKAACDAFSKAYDKQAITLTIEQIKELEYAPNHSGGSSPSFRKPRW